MTLSARLPAFAEAAGYIWKAVSMLNREGGIILLFILFLFVREFLRLFVGLAVRDDALRGGLSLFLTAALGALFAAAMILKVEAAAAGRGIGWLPAVGAGARAAFHLSRRDLAVVALLGVLMVGFPLAELAKPAPGPAGQAPPGLPALAAIGLLAAAALVTLLLLRRGWGARFLTLVLVLTLLFVNYATFLSIGLTSLLSGPLIVQPALRAVEGVTVNVTGDGGSVPIPIVIYCVTTAGASTPDLLNCLQANLPRERFQSLLDSIALNNLVILLLAHPSRGLAVVAPIFLAMTRLSLAFPAAALEGGLGLRRSLELTRRSRRPAVALLALAAGGAALLRFVPGLWLFAAAGGLATALLLRGVARGRRPEEMAREPRFAALLLAAGAGLLLALLPPLAVFVAALFAICVGGTAFTLFYLDVKRTSC